MLNKAVSVVNQFKLFNHKVRIDFCNAVSLKFDVFIGWFEDLPVSVRPFAYVLTPVSPPEDNIWRSRINFNNFPSKAFGKSSAEIFLC